MTDFTTDLNTSGLDAKFNPTSNIVADIIPGAVASVVDFGASVWNSLPGTEEVDTADLLRGINQDALRVYNENPDTIHTASFIGGMFVPTGLALKGMSAMRAGVKGINWFSEAGRADNLAMVGKIFAEGGKDTVAYRTAARELYTKGAINQAIDALAAETALVFTMNAHPMMEDYMADPVQNFASSLLLGGVLGAGIGHVADRFAIKSLTGGMTEEAVTNVLGKLTSVNSDMTNAMAVQRYSINIKSLDNILEAGKAAGKEVDNDLTLSMAARTKVIEEVDKRKAFDAMVSDDIKALPPEQKDFLLNTFANNTAMYGVDSVSFINKADAVTTKLITNDLKTALGDKPVLSVPKLKGPGLGLQGPVQVVQKPTKAIYFPDTGQFGLKGSEIHYGNATILADTVEEAAKRLEKNSYARPNYDTNLDLLATSAPDAQVQYIGNLHLIGNLNEKDFAKTLIAISDNKSLTGALYKLRSDPKAQGQQIRISNKKDFLEAAINEDAKKITTVKTTTVQGSPGAPAGSGLGTYSNPAGLTYTKQVDQVISPEAMEKSNFINIQSDGSITLEVRRAISAWINGDVNELRIGSVAYFGQQTGGFASKFPVTPEVAKLRKIFAGIYESNASNKLREEFRKISPDGKHAYLYRGTKTDQIKGSAPLESYTTNFEKAAQFTGYGGRVQVYKVDIDDIVAGFKDVGPGVNNNEIIVRAGARPVEVSMTREGKVLFAQNVGQSHAMAAPPVTTTTTTTTTEQIVGLKKQNNIMKLGEAEIAQLIRANKSAEIDSLIANGIPVESIALRTNTPKEVVEAYMAGSNSGVIPFEVVLDNLKGSVKMDPTTGNVIATLDDAKEALSIKHKPLVLEGNVRKNPYIEAHSALDNRTMNNISKQATALILAGSRSQLPRELGQYLEQQSGALDILYQKLGKVSNEFAGSRFLNSADFFARHMGEVGPIVNAIGKQVQRLSNAMIGRVAEPIQKAMEAVSLDKVGVTEFATFANLHGSISGWRWFDAKTGQLMKKVEKLGTDGKMTQVLEPVTWQGKEFSVKTPAVKELLVKMQDQSVELRNLHNTNNKILGKQDIQDIGFWMPSFNPTNKFIAYVHNAAEDTTKILWASTKEEYATAVKEYKKYLTDNGITSERVIEKGLEQSHWSMLNGRLDPIHMERADVSKLKTGSSSSAHVKADLGIFGEIIGGYEHYITAQTRNLVDASLPDISHTLDRLSTLNRWGFDGQPLTDVSKVTKAPKDAAASMRNIMLGGTGLEEYQGWKSVNRSFETGLSMGLDFVAGAWKTATDPLKKSFFGGKKVLDEQAMLKMNYEKFAKELETRGVTNPYDHFDKEVAISRYGQSKLSDTPDISKRLVYASNALAATIALRVGELAQPLVNMMSLPILTQLAAANKLPSTFMGAKLGTAKVSTTQIMYEGMRASNDVKWDKLARRWEAAGYFEPMISEANKTLKMSRSMDKGLIAAAEKAVDSRFVEIMSKPADWSEAFVRRQTMFTGAVLAKRMYPELDDVGVTIFARDFMDKAVGNFHAPQRPVFFQGTLGVALGLFQTYSLTLGQSIYRHLELRNYKVLGKAMLTQSAIFGTGSLPGFNAVSNLIGEHYSDEHVDLTTGTYRALQDNVAESVLYGLPSQIGIGTHTRGDSNFRLPGTEGLVAVNFAKQVTQSVQQIADAVGQQDKSIPQAFAEALSLQNLSRPLARGAELAMGQSVTRAGNTVQTPEEVWTFAGVAARVLATRPLEEIKLRDAEHLRSFYGSIDSENRRELLGDIKTRIRAGNLDDAAIAEASDRYLRSGGTPTGWRSAIRTALAQEETTGKEVFANKLRVDSPLNYMIDSLDGH